MFEGIAARIRALFAGFRSSKTAVDHGQGRLHVLKEIYNVKGTPVYLHDDGHVSFMAGLTVDADGSPRAYGPDGKGLDYLANAGHPGNWWGIATDAKGQPYIQGPHDPAPGYYVSTTSLRNAGYPPSDPRAYQDSEKVPFIVIPSPLKLKLVPRVLGCKARITDTKTGAIVNAIVGDLGPSDHLGEASIAAANALGINSDPKHGGCSEPRFLYEFWSGFLEKA